MSKCKKVIGAYPICNTASLNVYEIDDTNDRVLASLNDMPPRWYKIREAYDADTGEYEMGFNYGGSFVPFSDVMKVD
jgi:hypothetical protein|nr:MAG TPA: hypothetical protein [Caudoviricetes sp.]